MAEPNGKRVGEGLRRQRLETRINIKGKTFRSMSSSNLGKHVLIISQFELNFYCLRYLTYVNVPLLYALSKRNVQRKFVD